MKYEGSCYVGVVGPEMDYAACRDSIQAIKLRPGDELRFARATKGYEARQMHLDAMMESGHDFLLLLDHDQIFPADTLERLRSHGEPYVSGYYVRRHHNPILPVWYERPEVNGFPMRAWSRDPERGKLHALGASGWGCLLAHRAVIEGVRKVLKGEPEIIEDDMDVWPYDLGTIYRVLGLLERYAEDADVVRTAVKALKGELRPLRVKKDCVGSDLRFPFFAREAGFGLLGDPDVRCGHVLHYGLGPDDFGTSLTPELALELNGWVDENMRLEREALAGARKAAGL